MTERMDADRLVVTGRSAGSHFPRTQARIQYRFEADGLSPEGPFEIDGSVYGKDIRFRGPGTVRGPVLGRGDITLTNPSGLPQRFLCGLHASGNIGCEGARRPPEETVSQEVKNALHVVRGDVVARNVVLRDTVVFGSVHARNVSLEHCVVFGQVLAEERCSVACSSIMSYHAPDVEFSGPCAFFFASGESERSPLWRDHHDSSGRVWPWSAQLYPLKRSVGQGGLSNRPWHDTEQHPEISLVESDWLFMPVNEAVAARSGGGDPQQRATTRYVLSVGSRALDFGSIETSVTTIAWLFGCVLEWDHYSEKTREEMRRRVGARCSPQEIQAFDLATAVDLPDAVGRGVPAVSARPVAPLRAVAPTAALRAESAVKLGSPFPASASPVASALPPLPTPAAAVQPRPAAQGPVTAAATPAFKAPPMPPVGPTSAAAPAAYGSPAAGPAQRAPSASTIAQQAGAVRAPLPGPAAQPRVSVSPPAEVVSTPPTYPTGEELQATYEAYRALSLATSPDGAVMALVDFGNAIKKATDQTRAMFPDRRFRVVPGVKDGRIVLKPEFLPA